MDQELNDLLNEIEQDVVVSATDTSSPSNGVKCPVCNEVMKVEDCPGLRIDVGE